jgi:hypothetical protein
VTHSVRPAPQMQVSTGSPARFENRLPECNHSAYFSLKPLKGVVQKYRG